MLTYGTPGYTPRRRSLQWWEEANPTSLVSSDHYKKFVQVSDFTVLTGELDIVERRMMVAMLVSAGLRSAHDWTTTWPPSDNTSYVLSVGKDALDQWHQWGLVQVGANHGSVFVHDRVNVMVIEHPGTLLQRSFAGHGARTTMRADLATFQHLLHGIEVRADMKWCGVCQRTRVKGGGGRRRLATYWVEELDGAGLCDEHYRRRGTIKSRWKKEKVKPGTREAQVKGQMEMYAGTGEKLVVRK